MKFFRNFMSLALTVVLLASLSLSVFAASETATVEFETVSSETLSNNTLFTTYNITGSVCEDTAKSFVFEFNPADGNLPLAYTSTAGGVTTMEKHMTNAADDGYEVVGAINGSFFQGATSTMTGMLICDGRIIIADSGAMEPLACFDVNGVMTHVSNPSIRYSVTVNGTENADSLVSVNKKYGYIEGKATTVSNIGDFFYYDRYALNCYSPIANSGVSGYEILCNKLNHSEIAVGKTLKAEVVSVTESTFGATVPESDEQFVLFIKSDSEFVSQVTSLEAGDSIEISAEAANGMTALERAYSAISSSYWLVYNGEDQTNQYDTIIHSVTLERAWTVFGVKEDGTFVYFVNEEYGLTLKDVAAAMMELGCVYVIRIDGGGSSAVYTESNGIVYLAERPEENGRMVCDTLLIVKKSSLVDEDLKSELENSLSAAKGIESPNAVLSANIEKAESVLGLEYPAKGEVKKALASLDLGAVLSDVIKNAEKMDPEHYTEEDYADLQTALSDAKALLDSDEVSNEDIKNAITSLSAYLELSKYEVVSGGASYEITEGTNYDYWSDTALFHDDGVRLTDGFKSTSGVLTATYSAWKKASAASVELVVDLGEETNSNTYKIYSCGGFWGISECSGLKIEGSNDNKTFTEIGVSDVIEDMGNGDLVDGSVQSELHSVTITSNSLQNYRYIKFSMTINGTFLWVDEVEVALDGTLPNEEPSDNSSEDVSSDDISIEESTSETISSEATLSQENSRSDDDNDGNPVLVIVIVAVVVVIVAVAAVIVIKSRKK